MEQARIDIAADIERFNELGLLKTLLLDRSSKTNIVWATNIYAYRGESFQPSDTILVSDITGRNRGVICTRAEKAQAEAAALTKVHAEVFTPTWVCKLMIDEADTAWVEDVRALYEVEESPQDCLAEYWQDYVALRHLEITCGEAPYLVNRYDAPDGSPVPLNERTGVLDRKLALVGEHAKSREEWMKWALEALRSTYGYEYQGDNLLIARINVLRAIEDYATAAGYTPFNTQEYREFAKLISWNLWQMDGLTDCVPFGATPRQTMPPQDRLPGFEEFFAESQPEEKANPERSVALIYDWKKKSKREYRSLKEKGSPMKFDYIIGNPPYQEENVESVSETNRQKPMTNIFHYFQMQADEVATGCEVLIYPGGRWLHQSGKGMSDFGKKQINDISLKKVLFYADAREVFPSVAIADGISIVIKDKKKTNLGFEYCFIKGTECSSIMMDNPGDSLIPLNPRDAEILAKVNEFVIMNKLTILHESILPRTLFGIESDFVEKNPGVLRPLEAACGTIDYSREVKILTNDRAGKAGRSKWFLGPKDIIKNNPALIGEYQVVVSSANAGGQKRDRQLELIDNHSVFGRSRVALGSFKSKDIAINFYNYVQTYIVRYLFLMTDEALSSLGKRVPDLLDYSESSELIDFSKSLDDQLFALIGLDDIQIQYVIDTVNQLSHGK